MFTVADSVESSLSQRVYPEIAVAELTEDQPIHGQALLEDESLDALLIEFFGYTKQSGHLASLKKNTLAI